MNAVIYTKGGCNFCDRAKDLLEDMNIVYMELPIRTYKEVYLQDAEAYATSPKVFLDGQLIGGYTELAAYFKAQADGKKED